MPSDLRRLHVARAFDRDMHAVIDSRERALFAQQRQAFKNWWAYRGAANRNTDWLCHFPKSQSHSFAVPLDRHLDRRSGPVADRL